MSINKNTGGTAVLDGSGTESEQEQPKSKKVGLKSTDAKTENDLLDDAFKDEVWLHPSSNQQGQGVVVQCRVPPMEKRLVEKIVSRGRFPYETVSDLVRHGLMNHLRFLNTFDGCPAKTTWGQVLVMKNLLAEEHQNITFTEVLTNLERQVSELMSAGARSRALTIIARHKQTILDMPDEYWRKRYLRELELRFARYQYTPEE